MQVYNILIGCDQSYYDDWAVPLLNSIHRYNPRVVLHCHIVNPTVENSLANVSITTETREFLNDESKIAYLQSARFVAADSKFRKNEKVIMIDADSICTRTINDIEFSRLFSKQHILQHPKEARWLAGFVVFHDTGFREEYIKELCSIPVDDWKWGRDQLVLNALADKCNYQALPRTWMSIGKNKSNSVFLTLKGEQKTTDKYLGIYKKYKDS